MKYASAYARNSHSKATFPQVRHANIQRVGDGEKLRVQAAAVAGRPQHREDSVRLTPRTC
jgi:hypothetical protein